MSSYLNIYLQKKKKEGEEKGELLQLCSICRVNDLYALFYDNSIGNYADVGEKHLHEFTSKDLDTVVKEVEHNIAKTLIQISETKDALSSVSNKEAVEDLLEELKSDKEYLQMLMNQKSALDTLYFIFDDMGEKWCNFDKVYWEID